MRVLVTAALLVIVIAIATVFALRGASPRNGGIASQTGGRYEARSVLLRNQAVPSADDDIHQDALLLGIGVVPTRAAQVLHFKGTVAELVAQVQIGVDARGGSITIRSRQSTAEHALRVVNTFGEQLIAYLDRVARSQHESAVASALNRIRTLQQQLAAVTKQLNEPQNVGRDNPALEAQRTGLVAALTTSQQTYGASVSIGVQTERYRLIESVSVTPLATAHRDSSNTTLRATLIALVALALLFIGYGVGRRRRRTASQT